MLLALAAGLVLAAPPPFPGATGLDGLVDVALERYPESVALDLEAAAARRSGQAAVRLLDPQIMAGVMMLGAEPDAPDPTMLMVSATQMFRAPGAGRAARDRLEVDRARALTDVERLRADLRVQLWQLAARVDALQAEMALIEARIDAAHALLEVGLRRYAAGTPGPTARPPGGPPGVYEDELAPPAAEMPGMTMPSTMGGAAMGMGGTEGLGALLRLEAEVARLAAERAGLAERLVGLEDVLRAYVGEEAAAAVRDQPDRFLGSPEGAEPPELELARLGEEAAAADVRLARANRLPVLMVSVGERFMPDGTPMGTDIVVGATVPLWGGRRRELQAATARLTAAEARADDVSVALERVEAAARGTWRASRETAEALEAEVVPASRKAFEATRALYAANRASAEEVIRAWEALVVAEREAVAARRDARLREAELLRVVSP